MIEVIDERFQELIDQALGSLKGEHAENIKNIAIIYSDEPDMAQRQKLELRNDQTLLGLYEGVPLSRRQGATLIYPDKITLFKLPLSRMSANESGLLENIRHTLWHEIAHYYGLNHKQIKDLE